MYNVHTCNQPTWLPGLSHVCCILPPYVDESGTGHSGPLDGSADTLGGSGYLLGS